MQKPVTSALGLAALLAAGLALGGCVQKPPPVVPTERPTVAPVFKTDAEALAAARETYAGYLAASDAIGHDGSQNASAIERFVTGRQLASDTTVFEKMVRAGDHTKGRATFRNLTLQSRTDTSSGGILLTAYVCLDVSKTRVVDSSNHDVTPRRADVLPLQLTFVNNEPARGSLLLDWSEPWDGKSFC